MAANPRDKVPLLSTLLDRGVKLHPDNIMATKTSKGYITHDYKFHQDKTLQLASALHNWGVRVGDRVGTLLWNSGKYLQCYHAISCMGAVLHTLNVRLDPKDLGFIIGHANDRVIFVDSDQLDSLSKVDPAILDKVGAFAIAGEDWVKGAYTLPPGMPKALCQGWHEFMAIGVAAFVWPDLPETTVHALSYTPSTTGNPKGVAYSHRSTYLHTLVTCSADELAIGGDHTVLPCAPMSHVLSWGVPCRCLMVGAPIVFTGKQMDAGALLDAMIDWNVKVSTGVQTIWQGLRAAIMGRGLAKVKTNLAVKTLACGGSLPPLEMVQWYGDNLGVKFLQGWGMTETNPIGNIGQSITKFMDLSKTPDELFTTITRAGIDRTPIVEIRIANPDNMDEEMPQGSPGKLLIRGATVITENYLQPGNNKLHKGWLITGDSAKIDQEGAIIISDQSRL